MNQDSYKKLIDDLTHANERLDMIINTYQGEIENPSRFGTRVIDLDRQSVSLVAVGVCELNWPRFCLDILICCCLMSRPTILI